MSGSETVPYDDDLRNLVVEVLERMDEHGPAALEEACARRPDLGDRLRARVRSLRELGLVGAAPPAGHPERVGDFRLIDKIGSGGMGVVYRAVQESLGREVALKLIRPELLYQEGSRDRFSRETSIVARLQHPGIVPIHTVGDEDDLPWYAMELVGGCTLAEALGDLRERPVTELAGRDLHAAVCARSGVEGEPGPLFDGGWSDVALRIVRQAAEALEHAHGRGVLHRDLKPSNLMLTPEGRVMLVDFGLSQSEGNESLTGSADRVGSLPYMPPELLRDGPRAADRRSDVYGLGVVLYELITLHKPFEANGVPGLMAAILDGRPPTPRSWNVTTSWEAETVCLAAMEVDPERRYASAADFARDLGNALDRRPIEARRASLLLLTRRFVERKPAASVALALALLFPTVVAFLVVREARNVADALEVAEGERDRADDERDRAEAARDQADVERTRAEAERARAEIERDRADRERERAEENLRLALASEERARSSRDLAVRAIEQVLYDVADQRLDHVPQAHGIRKQLYEEARDLFDAMSELEPDNADIVMFAVEADLDRTGLLAREGRVSENEAILRRVLGKVTALASSGHVPARRAEAIALVKLYYALRGQFRDDEARAVLDEVLGKLADYSVEFPEDGEMTGTWIDTLAKSAMADFQDGRREGVDERLELAEGMARELTERDPAWGRVVLAHVLRWRGDWFQTGRDLAHAMRYFEEALEQFEILQDENPADASVRLQRSQVAYEIAVATDRGTGDVAAAYAFVTEAIGINEPNLRDQPDVWLFREHDARMQQYAGELALALGDERGALGHFERSSELYGIALRDVPGDRDYMVHAAKTTLRCAQVGAALSEPEPALVACERARSILARGRELRPGDGETLVLSAGELLCRAEILRLLGETVAAAQSLFEVPSFTPLEPLELSLCAEGMSRVLDTVREGSDLAALNECEAIARALADQLGGIVVVENAPQLAELRRRLEP